MYLKFDSEKGKKMLIKAYSKLNKESLKARSVKDPNATEPNQYHRDFTRILYSP